MVVIITKLANEKTVCCLVLTNQRTVFLLTSSRHINGYLQVIKTNSISCCYEGCLLIISVCPGTSQHHLWGCMTGAMFVLSSIVERENTFQCRALGIQHFICTPVKMIRANLTPNSFSLAGKSDRDICWSSFEKCLSYILTMQCSILWLCKILV